MKQFTSKVLNIVNLGLIDYKEAWELQQKTWRFRRSGAIDDTLFLLEHPHTYTLGKVADKNNLICSADYLEKNNISIYEVDRGGDITYHGPGQLVGYPIINLADWKEDTHEYLRNLENVIIAVCDYFGLNAKKINGLTGVWIENRKICAIGIKVSAWVTMHGFAFNVNTDLSLFNGIIPCGIKDKEVTSVKKELGKQISMDEVKRVTAKYFREFFSYDEAEEFNDLNFLKTKEPSEE